jgi:hypothetical protein
MYLRDKYGFPVERITGRHITNLIRLLLHTDVWQTLKRWKIKHEGM